MKSIHSKLSLISIFLSITAVIITWLRVEVTIENDTFVGIMAGLMGVSATLLVGVQIYNGLETSKKIKQLENLQNEITHDIKLLKEERERGEHFTKYGVNYSIGLSYENANFYFAYNAYFDAMKEALILDNNDYINKTLTNLECICEKYKGELKLSIPKNFKLTKYQPQNIREYRASKLIIERYSNCYSILKLKYEKDKSIS